MYGPELVAPTTTAVTAKEGIASSEPVGGGADRPMENPATNIGHQMMQKMGWKSGSALGRGGEEQQAQHSALAKDWDRIEGLAANNNVRSRPR